MSLVRHYVKYFESYSSTGAYVYVQVMGFVRMPSSGSRNLPVVKMLTPYGRDAQPGL